MSRAIIEPKKVLLLLGTAGGALTGVTIGLISALLPIVHNVSVASRESIPSGISYQLSILALVVLFSAFLGAITGTIVGGVEYLILLIAWKRNPKNLLLAVVINVTLSSLLAFLSVLPIAMSFGFSESLGSDFVAPLIGAAVAGIFSWCAQTRTVKTRHA